MGEAKMTIQSVFRYPGGKTKKAVREWITSHMPAGVREYREPFVGGGGVFWALSNRDLKFWLNDKHEGLIEVYKALRDRPEEFISLCKSIDPAKENDPFTEPGPRGGKPTNARLKEIFEKHKLNDSCDQAFRYFFVNRTVHGSGRVNYDIPSRLYFSNPTGWNIVKNGHLEKAAKSLCCDVRLTSGDYADLLEEDGEDVWIYADPPYVVNGNLARSSQLYQHSFQQEDHERFAKLVRSCRHHVCVSYDDNNIVRDLFSGPEFHIQEGSWRYAGTTNKKKEVGKELLILNYQPPTNAVTIVGSEICEEGDLSQLEVARLSELEGDADQAIELGRTAFLKLGYVFRSIQESGSPSKRLYRSTHDTFESYCQDRFCFSKRMVFLFIKAHEINSRLKKCATAHFLPSNERQYRELSRIPDDQVETVWSDFVEKNSSKPEKVTANMIKKHVDEAIGYTPPPQDYEKIIYRAWGRLSETQKKSFLESINA